MDRPQRDDVAVFVDFENVYVSVREKFDATPNFELIMDRCEDYGRIVLARAYADWYRYPRVTSALFANGVEPMYVPTYYYDRDAGRIGRPIKNSVDIHLCIDAMRTLYSQPHILKFVLVTGDRDFIPLVNAIRQQGKEVIIIGIGGAASAHLAQSGDEFLFYEQIADLKVPGQAQVQDRMLAAQEQVARPQEGRIRNGDRPEAAERGERDGRDGRDGQRGRGERSDRNRRPVSVEPIEEAVAPVEAQSTPMGDTSSPMASTAGPVTSPYSTLVDAIKLARQRGFVANLGSLKVAMRELDSNFHESKVKDSNGKSFAKFKDFVKEAENQGHVQIFTNGTVTEVFLPGEDPYSMSQFAEDLTSQQVEQELISELAAEREAEPLAEHTSPFIAAVDEVAAVDEPVLAAPTEALAAPAEIEGEPAETGEVVRRTFAEREWDVFRSSMSQFIEPVRFAEIFNALRGLRNQEVVELTNNELKELVKQAINRGMLQRTGRGAKAYYRLSSQYRVPANAPAEPVGLASVDIEVAAPVTAAVRRTRIYLQQLAEGAQNAALSNGQDASVGEDTSMDGAAADQQAGPEGEEQAALPGLETAADGTEVVPEQAVAPDATPEVQAADTPTAEVVTEAAPPEAKKGQRQRRRTTPKAEATPETPAEPAPKGRGKSRKPAAEAEAPAAPAANGNDNGNGAPKRRRRRKPAEGNGETQG